MLNGLTGADPFEVAAFPLCLGADEGHEPQAYAVGAGDGHSQQSTEEYEPGGPDLRPRIEHRTHLPICEELLVATGRGRMLGGADDRLFAEETRQWWQAGQRPEANGHRRERHGHRSAESAHFTERVRADGMDDRTRAPEQQRLERCVSE